MGGGVDLVTAADVRLCSQDAFFQVKEVDVGTYRLARSRSRRGHGPCHGGRQRSEVRSVSADQRGRSSDRRQQVAAVFANSIHCQLKANSWDRSEVGRTLQKTCAMHIDSLDCRFSCVVKWYAS